MWVNFYGRWLVVDTQHTLLISRRNDEDNQSDYEVDVIYIETMRFSYYFSVQNGMSYKKARAFRRNALLLRDSYGVVKKEVLEKQIFAGVNQASWDFTHKYEKVLR